MTQELTVSQFVEVINVVLQNLEGVTVVGEVDEYRVIHSKWVTFKIKDEGASVGCFMTVWQLRTVIEDGMMVRAIGVPKLRAKGGFFSFVLSDVKPAGEGALKRALELMQEKLTAEGLFAQERKRQLPRFPQHIALITSRDAAAYSDFLKVLQARLGGLAISFLHTQVQGDPAVGQIVKALEFANTRLRNLDAVVLIRGGGSLEDLSAFNDEGVVRAVAGSRIPIIVGVGHERDVTLAELAADVRASTPSNAAELLTRTREELLSETAYMQARITGAVRSALQEKRQSVIQSGQLLRHRLTMGQRKVASTVEKLLRQGNKFRRQVQIFSARRDTYRTFLLARLQVSIKDTRAGLGNMQRLLTTLSPENTLRRGYSITRTAKGRLITSCKIVKEGDLIEVTLKDGKIPSVVKFPG